VCADRLSVLSQPYVCPAQVGYVSPDMFTHSVSYFAEAPLSHHSAGRVQLYVYSCVGKPDMKTARLQSKVRGLCRACGASRCACTCTYVVVHRWLGLV
jgi:predicted O-linked N-acetylglucosamine transferase (SPINDLY family)